MCVSPPVIWCQTHYSALLMTEAEEIHYFKRKRNTAVAAVSHKNAASVQTSVLILK